MADRIMAVDLIYAQHHNDEDDEQGQSGVLTERRVQAKKPNIFKVLLHNDDYTPMDFVIDVLERFFHKDHTQATEIMLTIHHKGMAVCGLYPFEIAETKVALVTEAAREQEYPLQCTMESA